MSWNFVRKSESRPLVDAASSARSGMFILYDWKMRKPQRGDISRFRCRS